MLPPSQRPLIRNRFTDPTGACLRNTSDRFRPPPPPPLPPVGLYFPSKAEMRSYTNTYSLSPFILFVMMISLAGASAPAACWEPSLKGIPSCLSVPSFRGCCVMRSRARTHTHIALHSAGLGHFIGVSVYCDIRFNGRLRRQQRSRQTTRVPRDTASAGAHILTQTRRRRWGEESK